MSHNHVSTEANQIVVILSLWNMPHSILHDGPDSKALEILTTPKTALTPGYSKILLQDVILPERTANVPPTMAALDFNMMSHFSAMQRTEKQWRSLANEGRVESCGHLGTARDCAGNYRV